MADKPSEDPGTGRSRGRARGRATPSRIEETIGSMQAMRISPTEGNGNGGNGNGSNGKNGSNGEGGGAVRGRGGYRGITQELDTRPENIAQFIGTMGNPVKLLSNYLQLQTPSHVIINNFEVKMEPNIEDTKMRRRMIYDIKDLFSKAFIFDGMYNIKTLDSKKEEQTFVVPNPADPELRVKITIRWTEEVPWGSLEMLRLFNTQMRRNLQHLGYSLIGRNYFDKSTRKTIPEHRIELMMGLLTAIAQHDGGIMMVIDTTTKFIRSDNVLQMMGQIRQRLGEQWLDEAKRQLCGSIVMTTYNNKTYKIADLVTDKNVSNFKFQKGDRFLTMLEYYKEFLDIKINVLTQPLIEVLPSQRDIRAGRVDKILLVPELCQMTGLTEQMRKDFQLMKQVGDHSRHKPEDRVKNLNSFIGKLNTNPKVSEDMKKWELNFNDKLVDIDARVLNCERIYMGGDTDGDAKQFDQKTGDFSKEIRTKSLFVTSPALGKWALICGKRDEGVSKEFVETLQKVMRQMGVTVANPRSITLNDDRVGSYVSNITQLAGMACQMVVTIVANNNKERYDAIKKTCYCESPMPSQVVLSRTLQKKQQLMSVCTKIGIQMATKLGGEPWALKIPPKDLMVVGYDTYHDSSDRSRSVGGFVCSLNQTLTKWYSRATYHQNKEEMSSNFASNLLQAIKVYFDRKKTLPQRLLIYRDGVGEGQIQHVFEFELKQIKEALLKINAENPPKFAFVIVTKRVNARFFTKEARFSNNPIPGTIVDSQVTRLRRYDFYLISQSVRQGTVTPTMYNIIYDQTGFKAEHHQQLAYKLTHLYFNWPGTIRVPAPCQYAHKLAFMTGTCLHREPNPVLSENLFYL